MTAVLIMAGGRSARMRASGNSEHKALRQVNGVSLLEHNICTARSFGFTDIHVAVNQREAALLAELRDHPVCAGVNVLVERESLGTIGVAGKLQGLGTNIVVLNVDNLTRIDLRQMLSRHESADAVMTVATHREPFQIPLGEVAVRDGEIAAYIEKPLHHVQISSGTNVLSSRACALIEPDQCTDVPQLVTRLIAAGHRVSAFEHDASWIDVNDVEALRLAQQLPAGAPPTSRSNGSLAVQV